VSNSASVFVIKCFSDEWRLSRSAGQHSWPGFDTLQGPGRPATARAQDRPPGTASTPPDGTCMPGHRRSAYNSAMTTPNAPGQPAWRADAPQPPSNGPGWQALPNRSGHNVPVAPDEASIIVRIRQPSRLPSLWERASIQINDRDVVAEWQNGVIAVGVPPGHHRLRVWEPRPRSNRSGLLRPRAAAELAIAIAPRQTVELEYGPSLWFGIGGSLGHPPQRIRGVAPAATVAILWLVICVTLLVLIALQS
jgi:hypothetical protein